MCPLLERPITAYMSVMEMFFTTNVEWPSVFLLPVALVLFSCPVGASHQSY